MIRYNRLFALLALKGLKKTDLLQIISSPTLAKLAKGEVIKTDIIDKICLFLECQPSDIMEVYDIEIDIDNNDNTTKVLYSHEFNYKTLKSECHVIGTEEMVNMYMIKNNKKG